MWMRVHRVGMWAVMKRRQNVRGDIQLIVAIGGKKRLFRTQIKHGEGGVGRGRDREIMWALRLGRELVFSADEQHFFALDPSLVTGCVVLEPKDEVKVFGGPLDVEEIFLQVFETDWGEMATCKDVVETDIEDRCDATRAYFTDCRGWITEAILGYG